MKESTRVLVALAAAIGGGALVAASGSKSLLAAADALAPVGTLWVSAIRMTVIPLVVSLRRDSSTALSRSPTSLSSCLPYRRPGKTTLRSGETRSASRATRFGIR